MPGNVFEGIALDGMEVEGIPLEGMLLPGTDPKAVPMAGDDPAPYPEPPLSAPLLPNIELDCAKASPVHTAPARQITTAVQQRDQNRDGIVRSQKSGNWPLW
jgi:hypothetical protein